MRGGAMKMGMGGEAARLKCEMKVKVRVIFFQI